MGSVPPPPPPLPASWTGPKVTSRPPSVKQPSATNVEARPTEIPATPKTKIAKNNTVTAMTRLASGICQKCLHKLVCCRLIQLIISKQFDQQQLNMS